MKTYRITVRMTREYSATVPVQATSQDEADTIALDLFQQAMTFHSLGLPEPWEEHESYEYDPEIDTAFRCVDCGKDTMGGEYYMVSDELWAAAGLAPHDGMLCLCDLERRIGRELCLTDFTAVLPSAECWNCHVTRRSDR
jgi:hypothetical protein